MVNRTVTLTPEQWEQITNLIGLEHFAATTPVYKQILSEILAAIKEQLHG